MTRKALAKTKRLSVLIPIPMHKELHKLSEKRTDTITRIVMQAIVERITWEKKYE